MRHACLIVTAWLALVATGCLVPPFPPLSDQITAEKLEPDEQHLWKQSLELQHRIDSSGLLFEDPELERYLNEVAQRVAGDELRVAGVTPRIRVIGNRDMNAFAFANGGIYVHTALLARMENEAQLVTMLTREMAHVIHRHELQAHRAKKASAGLLALAGLALAGQQGGDAANLLLQAASITSMHGYHYALELEADAKGLALLADAGYDVNEAPRLFEMTVEYLREIHGQGPAAGWAFATPVHMTGRINAYKDLIAKQYTAEAADADRIRRGEPFRAKVQRATLRQAHDELDAGRFASAEKTAQLALEVDPENADAWLVVGEALEQQNQANEARTAYRRALARDGANPNAHRALGMSFYHALKAGSRDDTARSDARVHLQRYLRLAPKAVDAGYVRRYLEELGEEKP